MSNDVDKQDQDPNAIDAILRGLTNRPNVHSTLILSRRDGSIIKATGFRDSRENIAAVSPAYPKYDHDEPTKADLESTGRIQESLSNGRTEPRQTSAEILAASIYSFVNAAVALAGAVTTSEAIETTHNNGQSEIPGKAQKEKQEPVADRSVAEQNVQLLRMRTKKQEIIIFPDPSYLCCVIQNIGRAGV